MKLTHEHAHTNPVIDEQRKKWLLSIPKEDQVAGRSPGCFRQAGQGPGFVPISSQALPAFPSLSL